jgi:hypothetical protein
MGLKLFVFLAEVIEVKKQAKHPDTDKPHLTSSQHRSCSLPKDRVQG